MQGIAQFSKVSASSPVEFADLNVHPDALEKGGLWLVVADFEGRIRAWRFADRVSDTEIRSHLDAKTEQTWSGPDPKTWSTSLSALEYQNAVQTTREYVREGTIFQANICRVMSAPLPVPGSARALSKILAAGNPAPFEGFAQIETGNPESELWLASASPESFLQVRQNSDGTASISSSPIKGTAKTRTGITAKDEAENIMITDLVRNDLQRVCEPGTVSVEGLLNYEDHPGLVHLVSTVRGQLSRNPLVTPGYWREILELTLPPASVSGAPKAAALDVIAELEPGPRGPYCGAIGWIDVDAGTCDLSVGIRTFWWESASAYGGPRLHFGTGAGITWGSDPVGEWQETQLKAHILIGLASNSQEAGA